MGTVSLFTLPSGERGAARRAVRRAACGTLSVLTDSVTRLFGSRKREHLKSISGYRVMRGVNSIVCIVWNVYAANK
ncbi:hypothetical protein E2C01_058504 [Portunus trituberculatus]|uniref:Uncharacterized protein n=1 Tax=Portunus trituberculatus TaxID=210409 RepID=A0A5B7H358_PORTR|nr:hypothetical protein [Portunus trituberculatus]